MKTKELTKGKKYSVKEKYWNLSDLLGDGEPVIRCHNVVVEYQGRQMSDGKKFDDKSQKWIKGEKENKYRFWDIRMKDGAYFLLSEKEVKENISNL